jgi:hypothetical protein
MLQLTYDQSRSTSKFCHVCTLCAARTASHSSAVPPTQNGVHIFSTLQLKQQRQQHSSKIPSHPFKPLSHARATCLEVCAPRQPLAAAHLCPCCWPRSRPTYQHQPPHVLFPTTPRNSNPLKTLNTQQGAPWQKPGNTFRTHKPLQQDTAVGLPRDQLCYSTSNKQAQSSRLLPRPSAAKDSNAVQGPLAQRHQPVCKPNTAAVALRNAPAPAVLHGAACRHTPSSLSTGTASCGIYCCGSPSGTSSRSDGSSVTL